MADDISISDDWIAGIATGRVVKQVTPTSQPRKLSGPPPPLPRRRRAGEPPLLVDALEKFKVNVEKRARRASSMMKPWEVRGSNKEERIPKSL
jgi:hypothetical protein